MTRTKRLMALCSTLVFAAGIVCPDRSFAMTIAEEKELSREFKEMALAHFYVINEPLIADYVTAVGEKIMSALPPQPFTYQFYVVRDDTYNAFAGPGGVIFIHSGLIAAMDGEDELAGILAHEIAHGVHRHLADRAGQGKTIGLATLAALAASILVGVSGAGIPTEALVLGALSAGQSMTLAYSREAEAQADKSGLKFLKAAGYSPDGLLRMFRKMRERRWIGPQEMPTYLTTHPALEDRFSYVGAQTGTEEEAGKPIQSEPDDFDWAHTKLVALYGEVNGALREFEKEVKERPRSALSHYGYGLVLARNENYTKAAVHVKSALSMAAFNPHILIDLGRIYFRDGQFKEASKILKSATALSPGNVEGVYFYGRTQLEMGGYQEAVDAFSSITEDHEDIHEAYYFLGEAYGKMGNMHKAHYSLGVYYRKVGNLENAAFHLKKAMEAAKDPEEKAEIEEMIEESAEKLRKLKRGQRMR